MRRIKAPSTPSYIATRYVVAAWNEDPREYATEREAEREAIASAKRTGAADYYRVMGDPRSDIWQRPELLGGFEREDELRPVCVRKSAA